MSACFMEYIQWKDGSIHSSDRRNDSSGKQVLYLLPEIALTTQITERLQRVFGSRLGIYLSRIPVGIWSKQLGEKGYDIILGVRSSVFLPFRDLGLVIVDEEHENTYKQQDPVPAIMHGMRLSYWLPCMEQKRFSALLPPP